MSDSTPHLVRTDTPEGPCALPRGRWGAAELGARAQWRVLQAQLDDLPAQAPLGWDLRGLQWLDHVGAQLLWNHWGRAWPERLALDEGQRAMLERVARYSTTPPPPEPWRLIDQIDRLGVLVLHGVDHARHLLLLVGQMLLDSLRLLRAPRSCTLARCVGAFVSHGRHGPAHHCAGGFPDWCGAGLPHVAAAAPVRCRGLHRQYPGHLADPRARPHAGGHSGGGAVQARPLLRRSG